jgi:hypothetical protein
MKTILASIVTTVLIVAMTLVAMFALVRATVYVTSLESPLHRAAAMAAELLLGVALLLGTTWLATHLAVRIFGTKGTPSMDGLSKSGFDDSSADSTGAPYAARSSARTSGGSVG